MNTSADQLNACGLTDEQKKLLLGFLGEFDCYALTLLRQAQAARILAKDTPAGRDLIAIELLAGNMSAYASQWVATLLNSIPHPKQPQAEQVRGLH